ncbi:polymerase sub-unit PA [Thailand tick thogotovirus]|uniref:Polymerase sub-unit PA n=1 Tax=Thailand tick thogotovirus TaxID=2654565 RepID=A0A5P8N621_9ORTO|nr:polymerase sub-unit PA [Thailand tick thogotovirus]QFR36190.1 polymerase sub-unit PA [Thailand tick thogotovirus]
MDRHRPKTIDQHVWNQSAFSTEWQGSQWPLETRIIECVQFTVCCHISDMHTHMGRPRYDVLMWMPKEIRDDVMKSRGLVFSDPNVPQMLDLKENKGLFVKVLPQGHGTEDEYVSAYDMMVKMTLDGKMSPFTLQYLDQTQKCDISNFLIQFHNESLESSLHLRIRELYSTEPVPFVIPDGVKPLLTASTDYGLVPDTTQYGEVPKMRGNRWTQMKTLPLLKTASGPPAKWGGWLLGSESRFKVFEDTNDQNIAMQFLADLTDTQCVRESKATPKSTINTALSSIRSFSEGRKKRPKIEDDTKSFGIGLKKRRRQDEEIKLAQSSEEWKRADFPIQEESEPAWVTEELKELERPTDIQWLTLEENEVYTIVDDHAKEAVTVFQETLSPYWVSAMIEKMQIAATRAYHELHSDRAQITAVPIITRKPWKKVMLSQLWGFVIIGPHHIKQETDRIPIVTLELVTNDNPTKYPNHSHFKLIYHQGTDSIGQEEILVRVTSISKHKLFTYSSIRRVYIQPCSALSKLILKASAEKQEKDFSLEKTIEVFLEGRPVAISWKSWIIKILCIEFLMAVHNNSQMEGFLANIRRLHMSRHAMIEKAGVYLPFGSAPEDKCNECVINNPIVNYLARTWNELPNVYTG